MDKLDTREHGMQPADQLLKVMMQFLDNYHVKGKAHLFIKEQDTKG